jgi:hypothetical protein
MLKSVIQRFDRKLRRACSEKTDRQDQDFDKRESKYAITRPINPTKTVTPETMVRPRAAAAHLYLAVESPGYVSLMSMLIVSVSPNTEIAVPPAVRLVVRRTGESAKIAQSINSCAPPSLCLKRTRLRTIPMPDKAAISLAVEFESPTSSNRKTVNVL